MLASCDRDSAVGRRDYAILLLLTRLGLRAGEVIGITLDDIDWRTGVLLVTGKADQADTLPLPADVGDALADYVRYGRARTSSRHLFITVRAPFTKLALNTSISRDRRARLPAGWHPAVRAAPAAPRGGLRPAGRRRLAHRDRAVAAPSQPACHRDLRQGRRRGPAQAGTPLPAGTAVMTALRQIAAG